MTLFKMSVSVPMFMMRLSKLFDLTSRSLRDVVKRTDRSTPAGQIFCEAIEDHIDAIVAFAMQFSIKTYLRPEEAEVVLKSFALETALVTGREEEYYWKRFGDIPSNRGVFARVGIEYVMTGNAFLHLCGGKTGVQELDDLIRQFGADTFMLTARYRGTAGFPRV
jgi:hypothetical protein